MVLYACNVCGKVEPEIKGTTIILTTAIGEFVDSPKKENHFMLCESCVEALIRDLKYRRDVELEVFSNLLIVVFRKEYDMENYKLYPREFTFTTSGIDGNVERSFTVGYNHDEELKPPWEKYKWEGLKQTWEQEYSKYIGDGVKFDTPQEREWIEDKHIDVAKRYSTISSNILSLVKKVIINPPATIVIWKDGRKEVVKCSKDEDFNPEVGVAMCFMKRIFKSRNQFTKLVDGAWNEYKKQFQKDIEKHVSSYEDPIERRLCLYQSAVTNSLYFDERRTDTNDICYGEVESFKDALCLAEIEGWRHDGKRLVNDMIKSTESIYSLKKDYDRKGAQIKQGL